MVIAPFLAMTKAEFRANPNFSSPLAWMACHFSPYGTGVSNLPRQLPKGSLLILNDRTSWWCHDPRLILSQLSQCIETLECQGLLLDFQRADVPEEARLAALLCTELPCPVGVSEAYAGELSCPVFLPPLPLGLSLADYLAPWQDREIWLELALSREEILLTEEGCTVTSLPSTSDTGCEHQDTDSHCHYRISVEENQARFTLYRTGDDLDSLLKDAASCGVSTTVGLWQELHDSLPSCRK